MLSKVQRIVHTIDWIASIASFIVGIWLFYNHGPSYIWAYIWIFGGLFGLTMAYINPADLIQKKMREKFVNPRRT